MAGYVHRGQVLRLPGNGEGGSVHVEPLRSAELLAVADDATVPVHDCTEEGEEDRVHLRRRPFRALLRTRLRRRSVSSRPPRT